MGLWVLEPKTGEKVPGTVHVDRGTEQQRVLTANLKHGKGKDEGIVLVPQPSDSSDDPLNWPESTKNFHSWFLSIGTGLASGTCFFLSPSASFMAKEIGTSVSQLSRSVSVLMLCMGITSILTTPLARIYGKRPVFLGLGILGIVGYSIVLASPKDIRYIYAGRALWGAAQSGLEYLVSSSVGDLFFVHQRGFHLALWHFGLAGGNSLGQVIASQIVQGQGYAWAFRYAVIFMSAYIILLFLFAPETTYTRAKKYDTDMHEVLFDEETQASSAGGSLDEPVEKADYSVNVLDPETPADRTATRKKSWVQGLRVYNGHFSDENYFKAVLSPFATFLLPGVSWAAYSYGCAVAFSAAFSVTLSQVFTVEPYNFSTSAVGLVVLSPLVANILGNFIPGPAADWIVIHMSRRNNGVYEPEFRNVLCVPALLTGLLGYWGFGLAINAKAHWFVPVFFFGVAAFSGSILSLISNTYLLDCHRKYAQDAYAAVTLLKAVMTFAVAFFVNSWLADSGPIQVYFVVGAIHGVGCLFGFILYIWGKRIRLAVHKSEFIQNALRWCGNKG
ncbi:MFS general substrate transporter [Durotheca rogersii]|uniref:MFS general substrate transporter n=1 Tax=Durotheca rogersii TaxID=419775 RepID=UPI0022209E0D|nr:MFS general substrate transporter [Durotheca rogersii]KAI5857332.1 MFS general substrate transporter [Durotheca rogersii]